MQLNTVGIYIRHNDLVITVGYKIVSFESDSSI